MSTVRTMSRAIFVVAALALSVGAGIWLGRGQTRETAAIPKATPGEGPGIVVIDPDAQSRSAIAIAPLESTSYRPEVIAYGIVMDLQPLLALRARHARASAEAGIAEAAAGASRDEYERNRALFADDRNVSLKSLQAAEAAYRADQARSAAASAALLEVRAEARREFGDIVERWAFDTGSKEMARLDSRQDSLVRVTLPGATKVAIPDRIEVETTGHPAISATLVSPSPQVDPSVQGSSYLYRTSASLPTGLRLDARIPAAQRAMQGLLVPDSAIIWYGDRSWAFVQESPNRFVRRIVRGLPTPGGGIFVTEGFKPGERVVTRGAQLLHSEELRPKSPESAGCKDPECD
jgi:hypothetical protein